MVQALKNAPHRSTAYDAEGAKLALVRALNTILLSALTGSLLALAYLALAPRSYTATAALLLEPDGSNPEPIENQLAIVLSDATLRRVVERLNLAKDPDFALSLRSGVRASNVPQSNVINVEATASQADSAALIAQSVAEAYLANLAASKTAQAEAATAARNKRLADLKDQVQKAQQLIETFHLANDSVTASDKLVPERRLAKISSQLIDAREASAAKKASLDQIAKALRPGFNLSDLPDALRTNAIEKLREEYARLNRRTAASTSNPPGRDAELADVRARLADVETEIKADLKRKERSAQIDYQTATEHERELSLQRDAAASDLETASAALSKLAGLDRELGLQRDRLDRELAEPQAPPRVSAASPQARLLRSAVPPQTPSSPARISGLATGLIGGLALGAALALFSHLFDKTVRSRGHVSRATGLDLVFAVAPLHPTVPTDEAASFGPLLAALTQRDSGNSAYRHSVRHLLAQIRSQHKPGRPYTILFTSPRSQAGTTATALAVAVAASKSGDRVLAVDAASTDPELSRAFAGKLNQAALKFPANKNELDEMLVRDPHLGVSILPIALADLASLGLQQQRRLVALLNGASQNYDLVVIDAGALLADEGSTFLLATADQILVVAGAGVTAAVDLSLTMEALATDRARILGAVLTNAPRLS